ncbi:UDP-Glycosyltransferase superfamily protein, partial [Striga asiatica]
MVDGGGDDDGEDDDGVRLGLCFFNWSRKGSVVPWAKDSNPGPEEVEERLIGEVDGLYDGPLIFDKEPSRPEDFIVDTNKVCDQPFGGESVHARGVGPAPIPDEDFSLHKLVDAIICMLHPEVKQSAIDLAKAMEDTMGVWVGSRRPMLRESARVDVGIHSIFVVDRGKCRTMIARGTTP